jgi:lipopolysaccharide/colanic/teichoic acid biosynthesis glycosyltransferase
MNSKPDIQMLNVAGSLGREKVLTSETSATSQTGTHRLTAYQCWKGVFDRVFALIAVVILSPFLVLIAIAIRIDSPGSPVYRREQVGKNGKKFTGYKFRTMQINNNDYKYKSYLIKYILDDSPYKVDQNGQPIYKVVNDPRVTRFGALLRKTNLDELPQLFNILEGEMSLIGPRPDIPFAVGMYQDWHRQRLNIKPGITGLWQVSKRKHLSFDDMVRIDIEYNKRQSLLLDIKIALYTIGTVLRGDGS